MHDNTAVKGGGHLCPTEYVFLCSPPETGINEISGFCCSTMVLTDDNHGTALANQYLPGATKPFFTAKFTRSTLFFNLNLRNRLDR